MKLNYIHNGDCLEKLKDLESNSIDAIVTDPPAGISFMGKSWDDDKGGRDEWIKWLSEVFIEAKRVLKPGGHGLVWALPRTSHWTALALEDAGFEIRDCIYHIFGSGFPKSLNISKSLDKKAGVERKVIGERVDFVARRPKNNFEQFSSINPSDKGINSKKFVEKIGEITESYTPEAKQWEGWGTALKPAVECWWLIRKPLSEKTVAENILKWGTGGINIDGSRVGTEGARNNGSSMKSDIYGEYKPTEKNNYGMGRFPSHLIHDGSEEVLRGFPNSKSTFDKSEISRGTSKSWFTGDHVDRIQRGDSGSVSRFFYCAKPSKSERDAGLEGMKDRKSELNSGGIGRKISVEKRLGNDGINAPVMKNNHPTVKAQALMKYLIKLITPPKGIVLDMFAGSGSTLVAAKDLGFNFIGIEREEDYIKIAQARIESVKVENKLF